jgi:hypothetical protein
MLSWNDLKKIVKRAKKKYKNGFLKQDLRKHYDIFLLLENISKHQLNTGLILMLKDRLR